MRGGHRRREERGLPLGGRARRGCASRSSAKPMSSISSASSSTTACEAARGRACRAGGDRARGPAWRRRRRRRAGAREICWLDRLRRRRSARPCAPHGAAVAVERPRPPASPARAWARAPGRPGAARPAAPAERRCSSGQRERGGLAGAGRGLAEQVAAGEQGRDRLALDRGGLFVAERGERLDEGGGEAEVGEGGHGGRWGKWGAARG